MASFVSALAPNEGYLRRNRIWLKITISDLTYQTAVLYNDRWDTLSGAFSQELNLMFPMKAGAKRVMYLPVNSSIPTITFKNNYERMAGDLDFSTRAIASLIGATGTAVGGGLKEFFGDTKMGTPVAFLGNLMKGAGDFLQRFGGNVNTPKVWKNAEVDDFTIGGVAGFDNIYEYKYFKAVEFLLQAMTTPGQTGQLLNIGKAIASLYGESMRNDSVIRQMNVSTLTPPDTQCDVEIITGEMKEMTTVGPVKFNTSIANVADRFATNSDMNPMVLLALTKCFISAIESTHGTDDGKGIDNTGISRIARYSITFTPRDFDSVIEGINYMLNENKYESIHLVYTDKVLPNALDIANTQLQNLNSLALARALPEYAAGWAYWLTGAASFPFRNAGIRLGV